MKFRKYQIIILALLVNQVFSYSMFIPDSKESIQKSDVILLGSLQAKQEDRDPTTEEIFKLGGVSVNYYLTIKEVLKSPVDLAAIVHLKSPHPLHIFSFEKIKEKAGAQDIIILGSLDDNNNIILNLGIFAFWPHGVNIDGYLPSKNIDELVSYIKKELAKVKSDIIEL